MHFCHATHCLCCCRSSVSEGNSYCVFHYSPSILTAKHNLTPVLFPDCEDPLVNRPDNKPECMFSPHRMAKVSTINTNINMKQSHHFCLN